MCADKTVTVSDILIRPLMDRKHPALLAAGKDVLDKFWPTVLTPERCEFTISGTPTIIGNLFRVFLLGEIPTRGLHVDGDIPYFTSSDDTDIIPFFIAERVTQIPLSQECSLAATFSLDVTNNSESERMDVLTSSIRPAGDVPRGARYFNENIIIASLGPGKFLKIPRISIRADIGSRKGGSSHMLVCNAASVPLDDVDAPIGQADPRTTRVRFNTRGTLSSKAIMLRGCDGLSEHISYILRLAPNVKASSTGDATEYILNIDDSFPAAGVALVKFANILYPDLEYVAHNYVIPTRLLTMRIKSKIPTNTILENVCAHILEILSTIRENFA
jgi:hypothetical protein